MNDLDRAQLYNQMWRPKIQQELENLIENLQSNLISKQSNFLFRKKTMQKQIQYCSISLQK